MAEVEAEAMAGAVPLYRLVVRTSGLMATVNLGQPYDFRGSCRTCGAGAVPVPPLFIDVNRMGKKSLDATAHDGRLVVTRDLAETLEARGGLTGSPSDSGAPSSTPRCDTASSSRSALDADT